ncbi:MAG: endolytic transglycosylase MltG [Nonlabens sp.]|nr:endolytic transglycosylase MltG [Nonlabens sp.]
MSNLKKIILGVLLLGLVFMTVIAYKVYQTFFTPNTNFTEAQYEVRIPTGADYKTAYKLVADAVQDRDAFHTTAIKKGYQNTVKPGRYFIQKGANNNAIINTLRSGNTAIKLKFNNQERLEDLAGRIAQQLEVDSLTMLNSMRNEAFLAENGFTQENALSMYLPNQYEVYWNSSAENLREKMLNEYHKFWNEERLAKAKNIGLTPLEVSAVAAIVQKETAMSTERPKVAGVYMNRINKGMQLQADPTVIYAKKLVENNFNQVIKQVLFKDLEVDSPYNTYYKNDDDTMKYPIIPPGPIFMPDLNAIEAVLNYEKHDYLFFVADVENFGYHKFAKTGAQHSANAAVYHAWVAKQGYR